MDIVCLNTALTPVQMENARSVKMAIIWTKIQNAKNIHNIANQQTLMVDAHSVSRDIT
jgi:hypothetical protein